MTINYLLIFIYLILNNITLFTYQPWANGVANCDESINIEDAQDIIKYST